MSDRMLLVLLHGLGCSARTWDPVVAQLGDEYECVALDLPGHGDAADSSELTVEQQVDHIIADVVRRHPRQWALVGHSMGGKIAAIVAARAEAGIAGLPAPAGLVLVAASPLTAEPMDDETRAEMIGWCATGSVSEQDARTFVDANTAGALPDNVLARAVADVQRADRTAWLAWLERGSREDWSVDVGAVRTRTRVLAGADDGALGLDAQQRLVLPRVNAHEVHPVEDAAHLIMLEQPAELARLIGEHLGALGLDERYARLIGSDRVSGRTRAALLSRLAPPSGRVFDDGQRAVLDALVARLVPQRDLELGAHVEHNVAAGRSDGWRFAELPPDVEAWSRGLDTAAADDFVDSTSAEQDGWIRRAGNGDLDPSGPHLLTGEQLTLWLEDVRAEAVRAWISHPAGMARIGYDGFANGGDGVRKQGYLRVGAGEHEGWQPT